MDAELPSNPTNRARKNHVFEASVPTGPKIAFLWGLVKMRQRNLVNLVALQYGAIRILAGPDAQASGLTTNRRTNSKTEVVAEIKAPHVGIVDDVVGAAVRQAVESMASKGMRVID